MTGSRILVLEDDPEIRELVSAGLREEGYSVESVGRLSDAQALAADGDITLFIIDIELPDGNGTHFARDVRQHTAAGIILLTGRSDEVDRVIGLETGADDYIVKPFLPRELRARVNALIRRMALRSAAAPAAAPPSAMPAPPAAAAPDEGETVFTFHGCTLHPGSRSVHDPSGAEVDLTTMEFDVLHALARNRNRVLSRDQIMDHVKGQDWAAYDRTVDGLISRLRAKLFPDGSGARRIKTVRQVGYVLTK